MELKCCKKFENKILTKIYYNLKLEPVTVVDQKLKECCVKQNEYDMFNYKISRNRIIRRIRLSKNNESIHLHTTTYTS